VEDFDTVTRVSLPSNGYKVSLIRSFLHAELRATEENPLSDEMSISLAQRDSGRRLSDGATIKEDKSLI